MNRNIAIALSVGAYIAAIVLVNYTFVVLPPIPSPFGDLFIANLIVGAVFVLRDYAQRAIGHKVLLATFVAGIITWLMVDPGLAFASLVAFVFSEMTDWAVYSFTKRPLQNRIWISALLVCLLKFNACHSYAYFLLFFSNELAQNIPSRITNTVL